MEACSRLVLVAVHTGLVVVVAHTGQAVVAARIGQAVAVVRIGLEVVVAHIDLEVVVARTDLEAVDHTHLDRRTEADLLVAPRTAAEVVRHSLLAGLAAFDRPRSYPSSHPSCRSLDRWRQVAT